MQLPPAKGQAKKVGMGLLQEQNPSLVLAQVSLRDLKKTQ